MKIGHSKLTASERASDRDSGRFLRKQRLSVFTLIGLLAAICALASATFADMVFDGVLLNSGEAGEGIVDFAWQRIGNWSYTSAGGDGVFVDKDGSVWAAGADGVGPKANGYIYRFSPDGKVLAKYLIGENRTLHSTIAADDTCLYFLAAGSGIQQALLYRLDRNKPPGDARAELIPLEELKLVPGMDRMAGHLFEGCLFLSVNREEKPRLVAVDVKTGKWRVAHEFPPAGGETTKRVDLMDVDPGTGDMYCNRSTQKAGGASLYFNTCSERLNRDGKSMKRFVHMHAWAKLAVNSWTAAGVFDADGNYITFDTRFETDNSENLGFNRQCNQDFLGWPNQIVTTESEIYVAGDEGRCVMVYDKQGQPLRRIGALKATSLVSYGKGELWFLAPEGGAALGLEHKRSSVAVGRFQSPETARGNTPPEKMEHSWCDGTIFVGLAAIAEPSEGLHYYLSYPTEQFKEKGYWEIRMERRNKPRNYRRTIGSLAPGDLKEPAGLWLTPDSKRLLIADRSGARILAVPAFRDNRNLVPEPLKLVDGAKQAVVLKRPSALAFDTGGALYVCEESSVSKYIPGTDGAFTRIWRTETFGADQKDGLCAASGIAVDGDGKSIVVADTGNHRVVRFNADGQFVEACGKKGAPGNGTDSFNAPSALALLKDFLYVSDEGNLRIMRLKIH